MRKPKDGGVRPATYEVSFVPGLEGVIRVALEKDLRSARVTHIEPGMAVVEARAPIDAQVAGLRYLSMARRRIGAVTFSNMRQAVVEAAGLVADAPIPECVRHALRFRTRIVDGGELVKVDPAARHRLERAIASWSGLELSPRGDSLEIWVTHRRDSAQATLSVRVDRRSKRSIAKGELNPELASALVLVGDVVQSEPRSASFLDPFAGSGAIVAARAARPHRRLMCSDVDPHAVAGLREREKKKQFGPHCSVFPLDFTDTRAVRTAVGDGTIDEVITDPPWGLYQQRGPISIGELYARTWSNLEIVVAPRGAVTMLTAAVDEAMSGLDASEFELIVVQPILVSGKKAKVLLASRALEARSLWARAVPADKLTTV